MIHTSGSTGRPKGVMVSTGNLAAFADTVLEDCWIRPGDRIVAVTTVSFDIAALELLCPLAAGATVVIADRSTVRDPDALSALIIASDATVMQATPALWRVVTEHENSVGLAWCEPWWEGKPSRRIWPTIWWPTLLRSGMSMDPPRPRCGRHLRSSRPATESRSVSLDRCARANPRRRPA